MKRILLVVGTRPEAIKMGPVHSAVERHHALEPIMLLTGQHREQLFHGLELFKIGDCENLDLLVEGQALPDLAAGMVAPIVERLRRYRPDYVLVQGDTITTFVVGWAAFLCQLPVGHIEAGLRTRRLHEPFPEEGNRRLLSAITDCDFAPTPTARDNLLHEGKDPSRILVTGQTGIDALFMALKSGARPPVEVDGRYVVVTCHRRENWPHLDMIAKALAHVAGEHPDVTFVLPLHANVGVAGPLRKGLAEVPNFRLIDALEYSQMAVLIRGAEIVITDSGGIQEESAALSVPAVVMRNATERPEGVLTGSLRLAGSDPNRIYREAHALLSSREEREAMMSGSNPFGDGYAADRIAAGVAWRLGLAPRPADWAGPERPVG